MIEKREPYRHRRSDQGRGASPIIIGAATESEVQAAVVEALERGDWEVTVTSQRRATNPQGAGLTDLIAVRDDHTLFVECKTATGTRLPSQKEWYERHERHFGAHVQYLLARDPADIEEWLGWGRA